VVKKKLSKLYTAVEMRAAADDVEFERTRMKY